MEELGSNSLGSYTVCVCVCVQQPFANLHPQ